MIIPFIHYPPYVPKMESEAKVTRVTAWPILGGCGHHSGYPKALSLLFVSFDNSRFSGF